MVIYLVIFVTILIAIAYVFMSIDPWMSYHPVGGLIEGLSIGVSYLITIVITARTLFLLDKEFAIRLEQYKKDIFSVALGTHIEEAKNIDDIPTGPLPEMKKQEKPKPNGSFIPS